MSTTCNGCKWWVGNVDWDKIRVQDTCKTSSYFVCTEYEPRKKRYSRTDYIGLNGNTGEHYDYA